MLVRISTLVALALLSSAVQAADPLPKVLKPAVTVPVTLTDNGTTWTLDNGLVKATINKNNGNMPSLIYHGVAIVGRSNFWETVPSGTITPAVTIDPAKNNGARAEVAVKGVNGRMDIEVRYIMERGLSGFYTYAEYTHGPAYPAAGFGENRFILQMNPTFDWISVDADRNMLMCSNEDERDGVVIHAKEQKILLTGIYKNSVEHKYSYNGVMYKLPAWGWSSTKDHIGVYFMNPSIEYIGGGAAKLDLVAHMGATLLDYWTSGHYAGGAGNNIPANEPWKRVVGPIFVYFNALADPKDPSPADLEKLKATYGSGSPAVPAVWKDNGTALWQDAVAVSKSMKAAWPFPWVQGVDYPHKEERGTVSGQLVLKDPQAAFEEQARLPAAGGDKGKSSSSVGVATGDRRAARQLPHLTVGVTHPDYQGNGSPFQLRAGNGATVTWPHDGNYYQFWADGSEDGRFTIPNVRPGRYVLHAFADGVLGEYTKAEIEVEAGKSVNLGRLDWEPVRYGKQLWEIGYPDRTGGKFFKGDGANYWLWGWPLRYSGLFPNDIVYTIGRSDYRKDWFFEEVPHALSEDWKNPAAPDPLNQRFGWVNNPTGTQDMWRAWGRGRATTWTVKFDVKTASEGVAVLRIALAGADGNGGLNIGVNGHAVGAIHPVATNALRYNTDTGVWYQYAQKFDAALLKPGENSVTFTVPAGDVTTGVVWDYLRLELNDGKAAWPAAPAGERVPD